MLSWVEHEKSFINSGPGASGSKLNKVVRLHDIKISVLKYGKYIDIFWWKIRVAFALQSSFYIAKATCIFAAMYLKKL